MSQDTSFDRTALVPAAQALLPVAESGWLAGFNTMLGKELGDWFGTRRWWVQSLVWLILFNVGLGLVLFVAPQFGSPDAHGAGGSDDPYLFGLSVFFNTVALLGPIGIIILTQDEIIQEKQSGTAAWILTKPLSRASFILTKLLANVVGGLVFVVAIPGLVAYGEILVASGQAAPPLAYVQALLVMLLTLTFYTTLSLMLGAFVGDRAPLLAGTFGVLVGGLVVSQFVPNARYILPLSMDQVAMALVLGQPLSASMIYELITAALFSLLFTVAALWRFEDEEF
jgi:ABC-2 type transport system permease protein